MLIIAQAHIDQKILPCFMMLIMTIMKFWQKRALTWRNKSNKLVESANWLIENFKVIGNEKQLKCLMTIWSLVFLRHFLFKLFMYNSVIWEIMVLENGEWNLPTRSVGENNIAFFSCPLCKCYTSVFLPVTHCLTENGSLAAWKELKFDSFSVCGSEHIPTA